MAKIHYKVANAKCYFLHNVSITVIKKHAIVVMEDLKVWNIKASATGTLEEPGKNIKQKFCLNRSVLDQGWFKFRFLLEYKM
jgi:putative transposase